MRIGILALDKGNEPHAIRAVAETFGHRVNVSWIGSKANMLSELRAEVDSDILIISGHGDPQGFFMPEVALELQVSKNDTYLEPADLSTVNSLPRVVISTACCTGTIAFADTFIKAGARQYVAPSEYPDGSTVLMDVINLLYQATVICNSDSGLNIESWLPTQGRELSVFDEKSK